MKNISKIIKEIRKKENLTQKELADILGVTYQAVSKWENNKSVPDIEIIKNISNKFNVDINLMLDTKTKQNKLILVFGVLITISLFGLIFILKPNVAYEFIEVSSSNDNFLIKGAVACSKQKKSIYISNIKYINEDEKEYEQIECSLYEKKGNKYIKLDQCISDGKLTKGTLNNMLDNMKFKIDNYESQSKHFYPNNLFLEIKATNKSGEITSFDIGIDIEDECLVH